MLLKNGTRHNENAIKYLLGVTATFGFFSLCLCVSWLQAHEISFSLDKNSPSESNFKGPHPNAITVSAVESEHLSKIRFRVSRVLMSAKKQKQILKEGFKAFLRVSEFCFYDICKQSY